MTGLRILRGATNDVLLDRGHLLRRHLDSEVSARDHDAVGDFQDGVEMLDSLRLFELGDDPYIGLQRIQTAAHMAHVVRGTHERYGDGVYALAYGEDQVFFIFFGQRRNLDRNAGEIDALVLAQRAAVDDLADDVVAVDGADVELDQAVGEQDARSGLEVFGQRGEGGADFLCGALHLVRRDGERLAGDQLHGLVVDELAGANLRALQVGEDADGLALGGCDAAYHLDQFGLLRVAAVREVEAGDVYSLANEPAKYVGGAARRSERGNDLCAAVVLERCKT